MVDALAIKQIFSLESAAWIAVALLFLFVVRMWNGAPAMFAQWIAYKRAKAEEKAADWNRRSDELKRLTEHTAFLLDAEEKCRRDLAEMTGRLAALEGYNLGRGKARQEAAEIVAIERLEQQRGKDKNDKS